MDDSNRYAEAIQLIKSGRKNEARAILEFIIKEMPENENAWLWYASTFSSPRTILAILEKGLLANPGSQRMKAIIQDLQRTMDVSSGKSPQSRVEAGTRNELGHPSNSPTTSETSPVRVAAPVTSTLPTPFPSSRSHPQPIPPETPTTKLHRKNILGQACIYITIVAAIILLLIAGFNILSLRYRLNVALSKYQEMMVSNGQKDLDLRNAEDKYQELYDEYTDIYNNNRELNNKLNELTSTYNNLVNDFNTLLDLNNRQQAEFSNFKQTALTPPYITVKGREVQMAFLDKDLLPIIWTIPFDIMESDMQRGHDLRNKASAGLYLTADNGQRHRIVDFLQFVDSSSFTKVIPTVYNNSLNEADFIETIWKIAGQLTLYSSEIEETPRFPLETLLAGGGDCEDTAILVASMLLAAPVDWKVSLAVIDAYNPTDPIAPNHALVMVESGSTTYIIETTSHTIMDPFPDGIKGWFFDVSGR